MGRGRLERFARLALDLPFLLQVPDGHLTALRLVLFLPGFQKIEAGVVDVGQVLDRDVEMPVRGNPLMRVV